MTRSLILILLAGCSVGPDYTQPNVDLPSSFRHLKLPENGQLQSLDQAFDDQELTKLIKTAKEKNLDILIAQQNLITIQEVINQDVASFFPSFSAASSITRQKIAQTSTMMPLTKNPETLYNAGFQSSWELDFFGKNRRVTEAGTSNIEKKEALKKAVEVATISQVAQNYALIRNFQKQLALAKDIVKCWNDILRLSKDLKKSGYTSELQTIPDQSSLEQAKIQIPFIEQQLEDLKNQTCVLLGEHPGHLDDVFDLNEGVLPIPKTKILSNLPSDLLYNRPDIIAAEKELHVQAALIGVAKSQLFPSFSLTGNYGLQSLNRSNLGNANSIGWNLIPGVSLPIFNFGKIQAQINAQYAAKEGAYLSFQKTMLQALQDVDTALLTLHKKEDILLHSVELKKQAESSEKLLKDRQTAGLEKYENFLRQRINNLLAEQNLSNAKANYIVNFITCHKALGGT